MANKNMKCKHCGTLYHMCVSCGDPDYRWTYCSSVCRDNARAKILNDAAQEFDIRDSVIETILERLSDADLL